MLYVIKLTIMIRRKDEIHITGVSLSAQPSWYFF